MSLTWDAFDQYARADDSETVTALLLTAGAEERLTFAAELTAQIRAMRDEWWRRPAGPYALAVIACSPSAAKAADLLSRRDMRRWNEIPVDRFLEIARSRELTWIGDLGVRLCSKIPADGVWPQEWEFVAALLTEGRTAPPATQGVVTSWLSALIETRLSASTDVPFLHELLPAVFEIDGIGGAVIADTWDSKPGLATVVTWLIEDGRADRAKVLEMTVDRLVRGDRPVSLREFTILHEALAPAPAEMAAHAAGYAHVLGAAPSAVAGSAQRCLRAVDDAGLLPVETLLEASAEALVRPEKTLVRAQLTWLGRVARREPDRAAEIAETAAVAFGHPALDIQERALDLVTRLLPGSDAGLRARLAMAADALTGELHERAVALFGTAGGGPQPDSAGALRPPAGGAAPPAPDRTTSAATHVGPPPAPSQAMSAATHEGPLPAQDQTTPAATHEGAPPAQGRAMSSAGKALTGTAPPAVDGVTVGVARPPAADRAERAAAAMPAAIRGGAELAEEVVALLEAEDAVRWERVLAGLVTVHTAGDTAVLGPVLDRYHGRYQFRPQMIYLLEALRTILGRPEPDDDIRWRMAGVVQAALPDSSRPRSSASSPADLLPLRIGELALRQSDHPLPVLLSTPTDVTGAIDADVLVDRMAELESAGLTPWPIDFEQALLRVRAGSGAEVAARAGTLTSARGRQLAAWLTADALPDPVSTRKVQCNRGPDGAIVMRRVLTELDSARAGEDGLRLERLFLPLRRTDHPAYSGDRLYHPDVLAMTLPRHREVIAAWALPDLAALADQDMRGAELLPLLADAGGPPGPAMVLAVAYGLAARHETDRIAAVDAFLILAAEAGHEPPRPAAPSPSDATGAVGAVGGLGTLDEVGVVGALGEVGVGAGAAGAAGMSFVSRVGAEVGALGEVGVGAGAAGAAGAAGMSFVSRVGAEVGALGEVGVGAGAAGAAGAAGMSFVSRVGAEVGALGEVGVGAGAAGAAGAAGMSFVSRVGAEVGALGEVGVGAGAAGAAGAAGMSFVSRVGAEVGDLGADGTIKVGRVVSALAGAHQAGASGAVWEVLAAAIPALLPHAPRGLPDMIELATRVATAVGARSTIPGLAEAAGRPGSNRLTREAKRLHTALTR